MLKFATLGENLGRVGILLSPLESTSGVVKTVHIVALKNSLLIVTGGLDLHWRWGRSWGRSRGLSRHGRGGGFDDGSRSLDDGGRGLNHGGRGFHNGRGLCSRLGLRSRLNNNHRLRSSARAGSRRGRRRRGGGGRRGGRDGSSSGALSGATSHAEHSRSGLLAFGDSDGNPFNDDLTVNNKATLLEDGAGSS